MIKITYPDGSFAKYINRRDKKRAATIQKMADYFGVQIHDDSKIYPEFEGLRYSIEVIGADKVKFELDVTPEIAIKVFDLLKKEV